MAFIPTANAVMLEAIYSWAGQRCENVFHYIKASPWDLTAMAELAQEFLDAWNTGLKPLMSPTTILSAIRVTDISSQTGPVLDFATGLPVTPTGTGNSMPNNVALVITKRTAARGRSFRGRIYHPGLTEAQVTDNAVTPSVVTNLVSAYNALRVLPITADEGIMVVVSKYADNAPRANGLATIVTGMTSDGVVDSQRRRLPGRGN